MNVVYKYFSSLLLALAIVSTSSHLVGMVVEEDQDDPTFIEIWTATKNTIVDGANSAFTSVKNGVGGAITGAQNKVGAAFTSVKNKTVNAVTGIKNGAGAAITSMKNGIGDALTTAFDDKGLLRPVTFPIEAGCNLLAPIAVPAADYALQKTLEAAPHLPFFNPFDDKSILKPVFFPLEIAAKVTAPATSYLLNKIPGSKHMNDMAKKVNRWNPRHAAAAGLKLLHPLYMASKEQTNEGKAQVFFEKTFDIDLKKEGLDPQSIDLENLDDVKRVITKTPDLVNQAMHNPLLNHIGQVDPRIPLIHNAIVQPIIIEGGAYVGAIAVDGIKAGKEINDLWTVPAEDQVLERRKYYVDILKKYIGQEERNPDDLSWVEKLLSKELRLELHTIPGGDIAQRLGVDIVNRPEDNPGNMFGHNIKLNAGVDGYDILKIVFLWLQIEIEKKFFKNFQQYLISSYSAQFDQRKELLVSTYKDALCDVKVDAENVIAETFKKEFHIKNRYASPLFRALFILMFMRWALDGVEKNFGRPHAPSEIVNQLLDAFVLKKDIPRQPNAPAPVIPLTIHPTQWAVAWIRSSLGLSIVYDTLEDSRSFLYDLVQGNYEKDNWYRTLVGGLQTVSDHQLFDMSKRLFMWYYTINHLYNYYDRDFKNYVMLHKRDLINCVKDLAQAKKGTEEAIEADKALKGFIAHACHHSSITMIKEKNRTYTWLGKWIQSGLDLPIYAEVIKVMVNWIRSLMI